LSFREAPSPASKKVVLHTPKKSPDVQQLYFMGDAELDKAGVRQEVRIWPKISRLRYMSLKSAASKWRIFSDGTDV
jgi:hypothetical protein